MLCDLLSAFVLGSLAKTLSQKLLKRQEKDIKDYHPDASELLLSHGSKSDVIAQLTYLFHPYLVANCAAKTTATFSNLVLMVFLWACLHKRMGVACAALALATYQQFYPIMLLFPLCASLVATNDDEVNGKVVRKSPGITVIVGE